MAKTIHNPDDLPLSRRPETVRKRRLRAKKGLPPKPAHLAPTRVLSARVGVNLAKWVIAQAAASGTTPSQWLADHLAVSRRRQQAQQERARAVGLIRDTTEPLPPPLPLR